MPTYEVTLRHRSLVYIEAATKAEAEEQALDKVYVANCDELDYEEVEDAFRVED